MRLRNFCAPKSVSTPKGAQMCPICNFWIFQVEIPWNYAYSPNLKLNGWKLLHLWTTALFWTQNCPIPIGPFWVKIRNLGPHHLLDIITKEKAAKFQIKWSTASKVMRPNNVCAPKRVSTPKVVKICPKKLFSDFQVEIPINHVHSPKLKRNGWKLLDLRPTALSGTQNCPISICPFRCKIRNLGPYLLLDIITKEKSAKLEIKWTTASKVMRHRKFCAPKMVSPPKGVQIGPKLKFSVFQVEIPWNQVYSPNFKRNGWKLLHLWLTALSGTQNCPIPIGPFRGKIRNLGPYLLLDIITKEKPAKFQTKQTAGSKVLRLCNFCAPKRVSPPKGAQICPKLVFPVFQVEIPRNHEHSPKLKRNAWKSLGLEPTALSETQNCPISIGPSSDRN